MVRERSLLDREEVKAGLVEVLSGILSVGSFELKLDTKPSVILMVGVNGVGKTTTIGKLAAKFTAQGKKVLLAAGDTFRAAGGGAADGLGGALRGRYREARRGL